MNAETRQLLAKRQLKTATSEDYVTWAVSMIEAGIESKSILILASLSKPLYESEVEDYFQRSFKDLNWSFPTREECLRLYACDVATNILSGIVSASDGCRQMYKIVLALDYPSDMEDWIGFDDELDMGMTNHRSRVEVERDIRDAAESFIEANMA